MRDVTKRPELLTNILKEQEALYLRAAQESGFEKLYTRDDAIDVVYGHPLPDCVAVYTPYGDIEYAPFWAKLKELQERSRHEKARQP